MNIPKEVTSDILDSISEGIFTVDKNFRISFFNKAAEKITGHSRREVYGKFCKQILQSNLCKLQCPIARVLESGNNVDGFESSIVHRNGKKYRSE